jgi:hypothetical protein
MLKLTSISGLFLRNQSDVWILLKLNCILGVVLCVKKINSCMVIALCEGEDVGR